MVTSTSCLPVLPPKFIQMRKWIEYKEPIPIHEHQRNCHKHFSPNQSPFFSTKNDQFYFQRKLNKTCAICNAILNTHELLLYLAKLILSQFQIEISFKGTCFIHQWLLNFFKFFPFIPLHFVKILPKILENIITLLTLYQFWLSFSSSKSQTPIEVLYGLVM